MMTDLETTLFIRMAELLPGVSLAWDDRERARIVAGWTEIAPEVAKVVDDLRELEAEFNNLTGEAQP